MAIESDSIALTLNRLKIREYYVKRKGCYGADSWHYRASKCREINPP